MSVPNKLQTEHITIHEKDNCLIIFMQSLKHSLNKYCKTISYKSALHALHRRKTAAAVNLERTPPPENSQEKKNQTFPQQLCSCWSRVIKDTLSWWSFGLHNIFTGFEA